jgi:hypothetical protein
MVLEEPSPPYLIKTFIKFTPRLDSLHFHTFWIKSRLCIQGFSRRTSFWNVVLCDKFWSMFPSTNLHCISHTWPSSVFVSLPPNTRQRKRFAARGQCVFCQKSSRVSFSVEGVGLPLRAVWIRGNLPYSWIRFLISQSEVPVCHFCTTRGEENETV